MKNILQEYTPFEHDNPGYINGLINFARQQRQNNTPEGVIASSVIYANLVEYLIAHLLKHAQHMIFLLSYFNMQGVLFIKSKDNAFNKKTLGQLKNELERFEFPDRSAFFDLLEKFNKARTSLMHKLLDRKNETEVSQLDNDFLEIQKNAEEILQKYNIITKGLSSIWEKVTRAPEVKPAQPQESDGQTGS